MVKKNEDVDVVVKIFWSMVSKFSNVVYSIEESKDLRASQMEMQNGVVRHVGVRFLLQ